MSTKIAALNSKLLARIFSRLPMPDLMSTELVCKQWNAAHRLACESKRELSLYVSAYRGILDDVNSFWFHANMNFGTRGFAGTALKVVNPMLPRNQRGFTLKHCKAVARKFPNITRLFIYGLQIKDSAGFAWLLSKWFNLETLVYLLAEGDYPFVQEYQESFKQWSERWRVFWNELDRLKSLRHLAFEFEGIGQMNMFLGRIAARRLESLYMSIGFDPEGTHMQNILNKLFPSNIKRLTLTRVANSEDGLFYSGDRMDDGESFDFEYYDLEELIREVKPELDSFGQLTHLGWQGVSCDTATGFDFETLDYVTSHFGSLTSFDLNLASGITLSDVLPLLHKLPNLVRLRLSSNQSNLEPKDMIPVSEDEDQEPKGLEPEIHTEGEFINMYAGERGFDLWGELDQDTFEETLGSPLESVTTLHLANINLFRWDLFDYIAYAFPNAQELHFDECDFTMKQKRDDPQGPGVFHVVLLYTIIETFPRMLKCYRNGTLVIDLSGELEEEDDDDLEKGAKVLLRKTKRRLDPETREMHSIMREFNENHYGTPYPELYRDLFGHI